MSGAADVAARSPITILVAALGGEGGAVLADWIRDASTASGYPIQSTSIPGVAQRTGATTYYLELYPVRTAELPAGCEPVFALTPAPHNVDLMVASELVEAGRAMQNGYVTARTTLIAATHRVYATSEKMHGGDGRFEAGRVLEAGRQLARRAAFIDMARLAQESRTVISAVMFGAIAGADVLPLSRDACEAAIREGGVGVETSLAGFVAGWNAMRAQSVQPPPAEAVRASTSSADGLPSRDAERIRRELPPVSHAIAEAGLRRAIDYQGRAYGVRYLDRVCEIARCPAATPQLVAETARFLALWMSYEDIARVAQLKSRRSRFERVRNEAGARADEPVRVVEFLRPGRDEICDAVPEWLARRLRGDSSRQDAATRTGPGIHLQSTSIGGFLTLRALSRLAALRPHTTRFVREQPAIDAWLASIRRALAAGEAEVALEMALAARLIKGYGDTHARGVAAFSRVMAIADDASIAPSQRVHAMRAARETALRDPEGSTASVAPAKQTVRFVKRPARAR
jgi:indolepyruvate ferredoxin oxidoreductase beta subunit